MQLYPINLISLLLLSIVIRVNKAIIVGSKWGALSSYLKLNCGLKLNEFISPTHVNFSINYSFYLFIISNSILITVTLSGKNLAQSI